MEYSSLELSGVHSTMRLPGASSAQRSLKTLVIAIVALLLVGCAESQPHYFVGYLAADGSMRERFPAPEVPKGEAWMLRNPLTNAADLFVSSVRDPATQRSTVANQFKALVRFQTTEALPDAAASEPFFPVVDGRRIRIHQFWVSRSRHEIGVIFQLDRLGLDLLLAVAYSPNGLMGELLSNVVDEG